MAGLNVGLCVHVGISAKGNKRPGGMEVKIEICCKREDKFS